MPWIKWASGLLALIGLIWGSSWTLDERYARAMDVQAQIGDVKILYLESERRALRREKFDLENQQQQGPLTPLERSRLKEVEDELKGVEEKIKSEKRK
mgnify:CR=1 FL=1